MVENSAYGVTAQGSAGDRLEPDYNMENNPLHEMRSLSNDTHSQKWKNHFYEMKGDVGMSVHEK